MELERIISVTGKSGLFELLSQGKSSFIVKEIETDKRSSLSARNNVVMLSNVAVFTQEDDMPLKDVFAAIYKKENGGASISPKEEASEMFSYFATVVPNFDQNRVYHSDLKKLFRWYDILHKKDLLKNIIENNQEVEEAVTEEKSA